MGDEFECRMSVKSPMAASSTIHKTQAPRRSASLRLERRMKMRGRFARVLQTATAVGVLMFIAHNERSEAAKFDDDRLVVTNHGPSLLLPSPPSSSNVANSLRFTTDECGMLRRIESRRLTIERTAFANHQGDDSDEDDDVGEVPDPAWEHAQDWLYDHPEISVVTDGVDKFCGDGESSVGVDPESAFYATWGNDFSRAALQKKANPFGRKFDDA